jgi:hypothetical protein
MAIRSTSSAFQPIPPNYTTQAGAFHNIGRYKAINSSAASRRPVGANMCTAPTTSNNTQYQYVPRLNG